jgi:ABC-type Zn uptake system ZnuABC Zn-binding protein ZnuA
MVKNVAGDAVENKVIVPIGGDPHIYKPTPGDAILIASADQIFINALTFEGWILELIANSGTKAVVDTVTIGIDAIQSSHYKDSYDPHAWMDVSNGLIYVENIKNALTKLDPQNKNLYESNYLSYRNKLIELDKYISRRILEIPEQKRILITSHDAFKYYGKRYGLQLEAIQGISTEAQAQTSDIMRINSIIKKTGIPAIFIESTINPKLIKQLAKDNNVVIGGELFADSIGGKDSEADSYIGMLKHNTDVIVEALKGQSIQTSKDKSEGQSNVMLYTILASIFIFTLLGLMYKLNK